MMVSAPELPSTFGGVSAPTGSQAGSAAGGVRLLLRIEGAGAFAAALALYAHGDFSWLLFAASSLRPISPCLPISADRAWALWLITPHRSTYCRSRFWSSDSSPVCLRRWPAP